MHVDVVLNRWWLGRASQPKKLSLTRSGATSLVASIAGSLAGNSYGNEASIDSSRNPPRIYNPTISSSSAASLATGLPILG